MIKQIRYKMVDIVAVASSTSSEKQVLPRRNDLCWCGSGLKYKKCHLTTDEDVSFHKNVLLSFAVFAPIILTWLSTQIMYWSNNSGDLLWFWAQDAISMTIGVVCIVKISSLSKSKLAVMVPCYLSIIFLVITVVRFFTSCFNGDCL
jgi:hypothetical protein